MPIVSSGQLALSAIRDEFGAGTTSNVNLRTLSAAAGLSAPDGFNEFYGLSAYTPPSFLDTTGTTSTVTGSGTSSSPYVISLGTINTVGDYEGIYGYSSCMGGYYVLKYGFIRNRFTNSLATPQKVVIDCTAGSYFGPTTSATCEGYNDYVSCWGPGSNSATYSTTNRVALSQLVSAPPVTSPNSFSVSVGQTLEVNFYIENVVDDNAGAWGATGVTLSIYFIPA